jgi:two-component system, NtrC family, sensor kinase
MEAAENSAPVLAESWSHWPRPLRIGMFASAGLVVLTFAAALLLPRGAFLSAIGDVLQVGLVAIATLLAFQNVTRSRSHVRGFWLLIFLGSSMWLVSLFLWSMYEVWFHQPVPDVSIGDILLFVKLVPLTAALALEPHKSHDSRFRAFGLLDVSILMLYSLYLFAFSVYAYRLLPGAKAIYSFHFNLVDALGNLIFVLFAALCAFRARGPWRRLYRIYFFAAASYCLASDLINVAMDQGRYYSGSLYDVPLTAALAAFACVGLAGRSLLTDPHAPALSEASSDEPPRRLTFVSSYLAMVVTLSTPAIGLWLLTNSSAPAELFSFRLEITLLTIFLLSLLLSIKQDLLTASLVGSFQRLSETYATIARFKHHLVQSEKLASLGELVAQAANRIKTAMTSILEMSARINRLPLSDPRIQSMAGKISQYAKRTDALVENMLRFAQETPVQLVSLEMKPLIESSLQLSGIAKHPNLRVDLDLEQTCQLVRGDSSQLLHVFLQIISNAVDALEEVGGGALEISVYPAGSQVMIQFADSGPGIREPEHVFEPFYTTKPVGQGTGLGLSTCYGIIQQHGGEISCHNRAGGGAVFNILLPAASEIQPDVVQSPTVSVKGPQ